MIRSDNILIWLGVGSFAAACLFILALLAWFRLRRNARFHPLTGIAAPQTRRELIWMLAPVLAFALVVAPLTWRFYFQKTIRAADVTITVSGKMWSWTYKYPDYGDFSFSAPMMKDATGDLTQPGTYDHIVVPVGKTVRIVAVSTNVIYSWAIPSLGAEIEALPGRTDQSWFKAAEEGRYFGSCLELCGLPHVFKPIEVEVVSREHFEQWVAGAKKRLSALDASTPHGAEGQ